MKTRLQINAALIAGALLLMIAGCAGPVPVQNIQDSLVPAGLSMEEVYDGIVEGGAIRGWRVDQIEPGHAMATIFVRSHVARVDIYYDADSYSIEYKDSENLDYEDGKIHGNYNDWVHNLDGDIQHALRY